MREYDDMLSNLGIQPFTEAYYGKLPELQKMDDLFEQILKKARHEGTTKCNPNKYPEVREIEKIFNKLFGFKETYFYWYPYSLANAFTVTNHAWIVAGESKKFIKKIPGKGFYDTSNRSVLTIYGYTGILSDRYNVTGRELTAIFLHEVGHNFDKSAYHMFDFIISCIFSLGISALEASQNNDIEGLNQFKILVKREVRNEGDAIYKDKEARELLDNEIERRLKSIANSGFFMEFTSFIINSISMLLVVPLGLVYPTLAYNTSGRKGELFSDSFAAAYGYGSDLISGLEKMGDLSVFRTKKLSPATLFFKDLNNAMMEISLEMIEPHGSNAERCHEVIEKLEWDLKHADFPPELEGELRKEIEHVKEVQYKMLHCSEDEKYAITKAWRRFADKFLGGSAGLYKFLPRHKV